jgi:2-polyprenyl-3-methyl-5-hydroxy-6-metoxy-1,4-benzoquinol methylase
MTTTATNHGVEVPTYFTQARPEIWNLIPTEARSILDVGCGSGALGNVIKRRQDVRYCGIELDGIAAEQASHTIDEIHQGDITAMPLPYDAGSFDVLIFADILEHVSRPLECLVRWLPLLDEGGRVVVSLPNVRHFTVTLPLVMQGRWTYTERGILDETHLRFFTKESAIKLLADADLEVEVQQPHVRYVKRVAQILDHMTLHLFRDHMVQQWMFVARRKLHGLL